MSKRTIEKVQTMTAFVSLYVLARIISKIALEKAQKKNADI